MVTVCVFNVSIFNVCVYCCYLGKRDFVISMGLVWLNKGIIIHNTIYRIINIDINIIVGLHVQLHSCFTVLALLLPPKRNLCEVTLDRRTPDIMRSEHQRFPVKFVLKILKAGARD